MKNAKKTASFFLVFLVLFILGSSICLADIVPCGKSGGSPCTICHLIVGIQNLVNWGKNILVTVAVVGIVIAGIIYMLSSGSETMITTAKSCFKASLVGFTIAIAAWLMINAVLFWLISAKTDLGVGVTGWNSFSCDTTSSTGATSNTPANQQAAALQSQNQADCDKYCNNGGDVDLGTDIPTCKSTCMDAKTKEQAGNQPTPTGNRMTQSDAQKALDDCGVKYANTNTLNGLQDSTVNELCNFKNASGCSPLITNNGGTTGSHASGVCSHSTGCKSDFRPDSCNDAYIKANYSTTGKKRSDGADCYSAPDGACYAREGDHWDMSTTRSCKAQGC